MQKCQPASFSPPPLREAPMFITLYLKYFNIYLNILIYIFKDIYIYTFFIFAHFSALTHLAAVIFYSMNFPHGRQQCMQYS